MRFGFLAIGCITALAVFTPRATAADIGTAFTYQGELLVGGVPVDDTCDFRFGLWDADAAGNQVGTSPQTVSAVTVTAGTFTAAIDFGTGAINGTARWLEIEVQCPGDAGFVLLSPRVELTPAPHALALPGMYTQQNAASPNVIGGHSGNVVTVGAAGATISGGGELGLNNQVTDNYGTVGGGRKNQAGNAAGTTDDGGDETVGGGYENTASGWRSAVGGGAYNMASGAWAAVCGGESGVASGDSSTVSGGTLNSATGNYSVVSGGLVNAASGTLSMIGGGTSNQASGEYSTIGGGYFSIADGFGSFLGGGWLNSSSGATSVCGGGEYNLADGVSSAIVGGSGNTASGQLSSIGGGLENEATGERATIAGGNVNRCSGLEATVAGGKDNQSIGDSSAIGGGLENRANGSYSVVAGGSTNYASGVGSAIAGGAGNRSSGRWSFAAGGVENTAGGDYSFAGGHWAKVRDAIDVGDIDGDEGTFIWGGADSPGSSFWSTGPNQFLIRATGGVGIGTNAPGSALDVAGEVRSTGATGGQMTAYNPNNQGASVHLSWLNDVARIRVGGTGVGNANGLDIQHGGNNSLMRILDNGNVGIDTTTPATRLQISGGSDAALAGGGYLTLGSTTAANVVLDTNEIMARNNGAAAALGINGDGGDVHMIGTGTGNVGIGTNSPSAKLDVVGSLEVDGTTLYVNATTNRVGIGTTSPTDALHVVGDACVTGTVGVCSDRRYKSDVEPIGDALDLIERLRGVHFNWRRAEYPDHKFSDKPQIGFIAQEIAAVVPEVVTQGDDGYYWVDYGRLTPVIVEAIKAQAQLAEEQRCSLDEQSDLLQEHKKLMDQKDQQIGELTARLERLERALLERKGNE